MIQKQQQTLDSHRGYFRSERTPVKTHLFVLFKNPDVCKAIVRYLHNCLHPENNTLSKQYAIQIGSLVLLSLQLLVSLVNNSNAKVFKTELGFL